MAQNRFTAPLLTVALAFSTTPAASGESKGPGKVDTNSPDYLLVLAPSIGKKPYDVRGTAFSIFTYSKAVFGLPIEVTPDYELKPNVIKDWFWDFKARKYRLKIDTSKKFQNGRAVSAKDIEFMLLKSFFMSDEVQEKKWLLNIRGLEVLKDKKGAKYASGLVEGVKVVDNETLDISLEQENPNFLYNLTKSVPSLVPPEELKSDYVSFNGLPIGSGNYKVTYDDQNSSLVRLERVGPANGSPKIVDIVGESDFKKQKPDIILGQLSSIGLPENHEYQHTEGSLPMGVSNIFFNFQSPAGSNLTFRRLINKLIDRSKLNLEDPSRSPLYEVLPSHFWGRLNQPNPFDPAEARKLFDSLPKDLKEAQHIVKYHGAIDNPPYTKALAEQFERFGLKVKFERVKTIKVEKGDTNAMYMIGLPVDFQDPLNIFTFYLSDGPRPYQHPADNKDYDKVFAEALYSKDKESQAAKIKDLSRKILDEVYSVPLFDLKMQYHTGSRVSSIGKQTFGPLLDLEQVKMK